jgi:ABC-type transport system substrate-binding protein
VINAVTTDPSAGGAKQWWSADGITAGSNFLKYHDPAVDASLDSATRAKNLTEMKRYATRAYQKIADDVAGVWLYSSATVAAVNRRIETQPFRLDGWWAHLSDWSIPADKRIDRDRVGIRPQTP